MAKEQGSRSVYDHPATTRFLSDHGILSEHVMTIQLADEVEPVRDALRIIRRVLDGHLLVEEGPGGIFETMVQIEPKLAPTVERLKEEHDRIRDAVDRAISLKGQPEELAAAKEVATLLENHEIREQAALDAAKRAEG